MSGVRVALDTNTAVHYLNDVPEVKRRMKAEEDAIALPVAVVGELLFGALNSERVGKNLPRYEALIDSCIVLPAEHSTALTWAQLRAQLKQKGRPIPENDLWIAATCLEHDLVLVTSDAHFSHCPGLKTEDWLKAEPAS